MAVLIQATRQFSYEVARLMSKGEGPSRPRWSRPTCAGPPSGSPARRMQIHGGMGYAEEFPVSRYFVDARVLSIFEGADETLALKVIARRLVADASSRLTPAGPARAGYRDAWTTPPSSTRSGPRAAP